MVAVITGPNDNVYGAIAGSGGKLRSWTNDGQLRWAVYTDGDVEGTSTSMSKTSAKRLTVFQGA